MSRRKQRLASDQVFEFDRGRIVAYQNCGLPFRKIGSRVGETKQLQIERMTATDHSVTSRNITQQSESVTHHSVSARTTRRRLQQSDLSARRPLLGLPLTLNHIRLSRQWCDERRM
ncbi:transposable element Tcb1 transposase [Trichonephila clavipes]|nr:transposable element Tcb1 transposase [Trichonephila clavipes]